MSKEIISDPLRPSTWDVKKWEEETTVKKAANLNDTVHSIMKALRAIGDPNYLRYFDATHDMEAVTGRCDLDDAMIAIAITTYAGKEEIPLLTTKDKKPAKFNDVLKAMRVVWRRTPKGTRKVRAAMVRELNARAA